MVINRIKTVAVGILFLLVIFSACKPNPKEKTTQEETIPPPPADSTENDSINKIRATNKEGKRLFEENCIACHAICGKVLGPALHGVSKKRDQEWLLKFTKNAPGMIASGDPLAVKLFEENGKQNMVAFEHFSDVEIKSIYDYIESENCIEIYR